jgi:glycosyltransferase involved in cell wall biosynthesis
MATTMRVLLSATSYPRSETDWQGIFIRRMVEALAEPEDMELRVWAPAGPLGTKATYACSAADSRFLARLAESGGIAHLLRNRPLAGLHRGTELLWRLHRAYQREAKQVDLYHINWLQCALGQIGLSKPLLATVLGSDLALLEKPGVAAALRHVFKNRRVILCPNASWMVEPLRRQFGDCGAEVVCVPFGIDERWFEIERAPAADRHIWISVLRVTRAKIGPLFEWTRDLNHKDHEFHLFGPMQEPVDIPDWIHYHGAASPDELATKWYPRATAVISLSQHTEGMPQVLLEAMGSGLPVICSKIDGHIELVEHAVNGLLVSSREEFQQALSLVEAQAHNVETLGTKARREVKSRNGTWSDSANRYRAVYQQLTAAR